jgi:hypothetical protein
VDANMEQPTVSGDGRRSGDERPGSSGVRTGDGDPVFLVAVLTVSHEGGKMVSGFHRREDAAVDLLQCM